MDKSSTWGSTSDIFADLDKLSCFTAGSTCTQDFNISLPSCSSYGRGSVRDDVNRKKKFGYGWKEEDKLCLPYLPTFLPGAGRGERIYAIKQHGKEPSLQQQLRMAMGPGFSNELIEEYINGDSSSESEQFREESAPESPLWCRANKKESSKSSTPEKCKDSHSASDSTPDSRIHDKESSSPEQFEDDESAIDSSLEWNIRKKKTPLPDHFKDSESASESPLGCSTPSTTVPKLLNLENDISNSSDTSGKTTPTSGQAHTPRRCRNALLSNLPSYNRDLETFSTQSTMYTVSPFTRREHGKRMSPTSNTEDHVTSGKSKSPYSPTVGRDSDEFRFKEEDFPPL